MRTDEAVSKYIERTPEAARATFKQLRAAVQSVAPKDAVEVISYGIPAVKTQKIVVWYAAFAKHCSLFPTAEVLQKFKSELKRYKISKGTVQFPLDQPLPAALVKKIVKARLASMRG